MSSITQSGVRRPARQGDIVAYLLGLGSYAYQDSVLYAEEYTRLHQVIRALAQSTEGDRESDILRYGAQLSQVDRVLAALFVEGALERLAAPGPGWAHISEDVYFRAAVAHARLIDYLCQAGHFAIPPNCEHGDALARYQRFSAYFLCLPEGNARHGLRLGILSLFDRAEDDVAVGLALCEELRGQDSILAGMAADRVLLAIERGEIGGYDAAYRDLGVRMVATAGRWHIFEALPHLRRLFEATPPRDRDARVLRANVQRAIDQLSTWR